MHRSFTNTVEAARANVEALGDALAYTLLADGDKQETHLTYHELDRQARAIAGRLQSELRPGERAILIYPTSAEFLAAFFGCLYAGVIAVPVVEPVKAGHLLRIKSIVEDAQARMILTTSQLLPRFDTWAEASPDLRSFRWLATDTVEPAWADPWRMPALERDTVAFLQYTSGSTGAPRGVMVTHGNLVGNCEMLIQALQVGRDTVGVSWLPLFHDMGLISKVVLTAYVGSRSVLMPPAAFLQRPMRWLKAISRYRGYYSAGPDFAYALAARKATPAACEGLDLSSWRVAANGAEPVRPATIQAFVEAFAPYGFRPEAMRPCYGLAEATLVVSFSREQRPAFYQVEAAEFEKKRLAPAVDGQAALTLVGCGRTSLGGQSVRIVHPETQQACAPGEVGEIWVAGENVAAGYWQQPELSAATFQARIAGTGEGPFMRTGDLGFYHDDQLYIAGRIKDLIIIDGSNHYPQDLELTVEGAHPAVRPGCAAAFSVDRDGQERLVVVAELEQRGASNGALDPSQVAQAIRQSLAAEHGVRLDDVVFIKPRSLPKTSSGKLQRRACRAAYLSGALEPC